MKAEPQTSEHRVSAHDRAQRLTLRAESREEQQALARLARAIMQPDWYERLAHELEEMQRGEAERHG